MSSKQNDIKDQEFIELLIEKYPMGNSPHLIEYFCIVGYEETYIQEKIIKNINSIIETDKEKEFFETNIYNEYKCRHLPTILSSISSNFNGPISNETYLIENIFPIPPTIYYNSQKNFIYEPSPKNVIFTNIQNEIVNFIYGYIFYEKKMAYYNSNIYIPKAFIIISQYSFFNTFYKLCKELLYNQFKSSSLEIPIEIQLYNIINFIPAPINEKINITFFPSNNLSEIISKCNTDKDLINLNEQKMYNLNQLSGYRYSEIDFSIIFCLLSIDLIIQIYMQLLTGKTIAFFSKNIEILNFSIYIFQQLFYPLSHDETVNSLSPIRYFCTEFFTQNIVGFLCSYDEVEKYNPFRNTKPNEFKCLSEDEENEELNYSLFGCDFIVDLDKKCLIEVDNNKNKIDDYEKYKNNISFLFNFIYNILNSNNDTYNENTKLEKAIIKLKNSLKKVKSKLFYSENIEKIPNFLNNNTIFNNDIQEAFYQFNLEISFLYFQDISKYNGDYRMDKNSQFSGLKDFQETYLNKNDYLFLILFSNTFYCNILNNFVGGYSKDEPLLYKTPRIIFDNFISLKKILAHMDIKNDNLTKNSFDIIDNIYINKNLDNTPKEKNISFLNFYKFYKNNLNISISKLVDNSYVEVIIDKNNEKDVKFYYKYKTISLDKNLIMEYIYMIEEIIKEKDNNLFPIDNDSYIMYKPINQKISTISIYNTFEKYFINSNSVEYIDIIIISIINIVALSINKKTLIPFTFSVYSLFQRLYFSVRKFIEIILSISYRLFIKDETQNSFTYEKYFNLYTICIESNNLFPNDQLIYLKNQITNYSLKVKNKYKEVFDEKFKKLEGLEIDKLYSIDSQKNYKEISDILENSNLDDNIQNKIIIKSRYFKKKIISYNDIYSPLKIYNISSQILENYYKNLNFNIMNKYQYEKILICLLFYSKIFENELPKDINKFLFYCFIVEKQ